MINKETIIICDDMYKEVLLNNSDTLYPVHYMTKENFIKKYMFDYDYKAIIYLMNKYGYKCEVAIKYLDNIYYIEDIEYVSDKLEFLKHLKKELEDKNLLIYDFLFKEYIKDKDIIIYKNDLNKLESKIFNSLNNVKVIEKEYKDYIPEIYALKDKEDEVTFVAKKICKLIENGIPLNQIKISNIKGYENMIEKIFTFYHLPFNINFKYSIYSTKVVKDFIANYDGDIYKCLEIIDKYKDTTIYEQIVDICNKYIEDVPLELLIYNFKHTYIKNIKYKEAIEEIDFKNNEIKDEYVFLLGFNSSNIPYVYYDEDYINDDIKGYVNLDTTLEKNIKEKEITIKSLKNIKNLIITYKNYDGRGVCYPSILISICKKMEVLDDFTISYSTLNDKLNYSILLDNYLKYGEINKLIDIYQNSYEIPYLTYSNKYTKINNFKNDNLILSYSSIDKYNKCGFRYYLSNVLKLELFEENFYTIIGNLFHHILEKAFKMDIDINEEVKLFIKDKNLTNKDMFYINKLTGDLPLIINTIKVQLKLSKLNKSIEEKEVIIDKGNNVIFKGYIDKILYNDDKDTTIALIDYKTGSADIDLSYLNYGINMQLPIYLYLASKLDFKNINFAGFYLQKVLLPSIKRDREKTIIDQKKNYLKWEGYSNSDEKLLNILDITYKDSSFIKSLKLNKDNTFYTHAKVLSTHEIEKLIDFTEHKINNSIDNILKCNFDINPKRSDKELIGCTFCKFKDICYKTKQDEVYMKSTSISDLLEGLK